MTFDSKPQLYKLLAQDEMRQVASAVHTRFGLEAMATMSSHEYGLRLWEMAHDLYCAKVPNPRCDCGETISPDVPHVTLEPNGVFWHGNAKGGGHSANFETGRPKRNLRVALAPSLPDPEEVIEDVLVLQEGYYPHQMAQKIAEALRDAGLLKGQSG